MSRINNSPARQRASVTVVIACYNAAATLEEAISSVLSQTVADLELIVVDDGSVDGSPELVRELMADDRRLRLIEQPNAGPSAARNRGVAASQSQFVAFIDADDIWRADHLQLNLAALIATPRLGVSYSPCKIIDHLGKLTGEASRVRISDVTLADMLSSNPTATCSSLVVRREVFETAGLMRTDMTHAEDQEWLFRVIHSGWLVRGIAQPTVHYRASPQGLSASTELMFAGWKVFLDHARRVAPGLVASQESRATSRMHFYFARRAIQTSQRASIARRHFASALTASPRTAASTLLQTTALASACIAPKLANRTLSALRIFRHA